MEHEALEKLKYPVGKFSKPEAYTADLIETWKLTISDFPSKLKNEVTGLSESQLDTPYRPGGWTVRQVVHHCGDSHMNAFIRFKLALTEDKPTVKAYEEQFWAEQADYKLPIEISLNLITPLHFRWSTLLNSLTTADFESRYIHPQTGNELDLYYMLGLYDWHCRHHLSHITELIKRSGW
ncbi:MAG: putative metal-dependent hydrolase [Bacteroidota bacterium]